MIQRLRSDVLQPFRPTGRFHRACAIAQGAASAAFGVIAGCDVRSGGSVETFAWAVLAASLAFVHLLRAWSLERGPR